MAYRYAVPSEEMFRNYNSSWMYLYKMRLRILDTQLCAKGMEKIGKLWHVLAPSLSQRGPLYVLILIASDRVVLLLDGIQE